MYASVAAVKSPVCVCTISSGTVIPYSDHFFSNCSALGPSATTVTARRWSGAIDVPYASASSAPAFMSSTSTTTVCRLRAA